MIKKYISTLYYTLIIVLFSICLVGISKISYAQEELVIKDQVVAVVNNHIILQSDIDQQVGQYLFFTKQSDKTVSFSPKLWYDMLYQAIENYAMYEKAIGDSIRVSDEEVNRAINQRIQQVAQNLGGERALEIQYGKTIPEIRDTYRKQFREELTLQQLKKNILGNITTTRKDILDYYNQIPKDSLPQIPEQITLSQIVINAQPNKQQKQKVHNLLSSIRDSIIAGHSTFEEMAVRYSQDLQSSPKGGLLPALEVNLLMPEYSAAASVLNPRQISRVIETDIGFHVIRLEEQIGTRIKTSHILFRLDDIPPDEKYTINKLNAIRDSIITNNSSFEEVAKKLSEDPYTSRFGGRILNPQTGSKYLTYDDLDPALYRIVLVLEPNQISEPKLYRNPANKGANSYRIIRLHTKTKNHKATIEQDYDYFHVLVSSEKQTRIFEQWKQSIYKNIFIEIKIDIPEKYQQKRYLN